MNKLSFVTKKIKLLVLLFTVLISSLGYFAGSASAVGCKITSGHSVKRVQSALNSEGGYKLYIDGKMGNATCSAIKAFQDKKNLAADGNVGPATAKALGLPIPAKASTKSNLKCSGKATSCFIAVKGSNYQGNLYIIHEGELKATYSAVFGGKGHRTPNGVFKITSSKGSKHTSTKYPSDEPNMNYPVYFNGAIAIHGSYGVPDSAGSHGCVRVKWDNGPKVYNWYKTYGITQVIVK